jgi:hypothetical protein
METNIHSSDKTTIAYVCVCVCLKLRCGATFLEDKLTKNSMPMHDSQTQFLFVFVNEEDGFSMVDKLVHVLRSVGFISKFEEHEDKNTDAFRT